MEFGAGFCHYKKIKLAALHCQSLVSQLKLKHIHTNQMKSLAETISSSYFYGKVVWLVETHFRINFD